MCFVKERKIGYLDLIQAPGVANRQSLQCNQEQKLPEIRAIREKNTILEHLKLLI